MLLLLCLSRFAAAVVLTLVTVGGPVLAETIGAAAVSQATQQSATIDGRVNGSSAAGLAGAIVNIDGPVRASTTTDGSGKFTFNVPPGAYTITVNKGGYQTGSTQVVATSAIAVTISVGLTESSLGNLQVIGRTSVNATGNAAKFNISSSSNSALSQAAIQDRNVPEIAKLVSTLPGVVVTTNSASVVNNFRIRGTTAETKTQLDGHPISSGVSGTFLASFTDSGLLSSVDVLKGAGLNGPTAGESAVGTVNLRTPDFGAKDTSFLQGGVDNYGASFYTALVDINLGTKLSFIFGKSFSGYRGNNFGASVDGIVAGGTGSGATATNPGPKIGPTGTYQTPYLTNSLAAYNNDFSSTQTLNAQLAKVRYKFSDATSVSAEFFGSQGQYDPEGGSYGQFVGYATLPQCLTKGVAANGASCNLTSVYNSPFVQGQVGQANTPLYTFFPGTVIRNNNPNFDLDFKTTFKNDTILLRPYTASINRLIDGSGQNSVYANGPTQVAQGSYAVISNANCQVQFIAPTATGGAKGPCYASGAASNTPGFVTSTTGLSTTFPVTTSPAGIYCSLAVPCYTTPTQQDNAGQWGFGTTSTQQEIDKLAGYTFTYIHPVGNNIYNFSIDHYYDDTQSYQSDASPLVSGCAFTQLGGNAPKASDPGYQPGCKLIGPNGTNTVVYKPTPLAVPETFSSITSFSLTAQFQLQPDLEFDFGNYFTTYRINAQQEDPAFLAAFIAAQTAAGNPVNTNIAPIRLSGFTNKESHYDPHFGFVYRPSRDLAIRATAGSSVSIPYASQVSGLETVVPTTASTTITAPNPNLQAEVVVAEDIGLDYRFGHGAVFAGDIYNNVIHNTWITENALLANPPQGFASGGVYYLSSTFNGPEEHSKGIELNVASLPALGFGYSLSTSFNRTYYANLPPSYLVVATKDFNWIQQYGEPYSKGYLNLQYAGLRNSLLRLGVDYEGPGNSANYTSYFQFDAGLRLGFANKIEFLTSVENLTDLTFGAPLGHAVAFQGVVPVQEQLVNGVVVYSNGPSRGISAPLPRTFRFSLVKRF